MIEKNVYCMLLQLICNVNVIWKMNVYIFYIAVNVVTEETTLITLVIISPLIQGCNNGSETVREAPLLLLKDIVSCFA